MKKKAEKVKQSEELKISARDRIHRDPLDVSGHHGRTRHQASPLGGSSGRALRGG